MEVYGESPAQPVFSAEFELPPQRAAMLALSELRLPPDTEPRTLEDDAAQAGGESAAERSVPQCAAVCHGVEPGPARGWRPRSTCCRRSIASSNSRAVFVPTMVLAGVLLLLAGAMLGYSQWSERQYLKPAWSAEIAKLEPLRKRADALDQRDRAHARAGATAGGVPQADAQGSGRVERTDPSDGAADVEQNTEIARDTVRLDGEAPQAAPLVQILDASPSSRRLRDSNVRAAGQWRGIPDPQPVPEAANDPGTLDRKTAILGAVGVRRDSAAALCACWRTRTPDVVAASESVPMAGERLERCAQIAATVPGKRNGHERGRRPNCESREKGMLKAETSAQAQAQLQEMLHRLGQLNGIDIRGMEDARMRLLGNDYGEASVTVRFSLPDRTTGESAGGAGSEPELVSTNQIQITGGPDKAKTIQVRLTLAGVVPKKLAQEKKSGSGL